MTVQQITNQLPCGYRVRHAPMVRGRMKELQSHYKTCPHDYCKGRRAAWLQLVKQFQQGRNPTK